MPTRNKTKKMAGRKVSIYLPAILEKICRDTAKRTGQSLSAVIAKIIAGAK